MDHAPTPKFGADAVDYGSIARQIREMQVRALTAPQLDDVLTLIEWLRADTLRQANQLASDRRDLDAAEAAHKQAANELSLRSRAVAMIINAQPPARKRRWLGNLGGYHG